MHTRIPIALAVIAALMGSAAAASERTSESLTVPLGSSVTIDGKATDGEWNDAALRKLSSAGGDLLVRVKHDEKALLVGFAGLSESPFRVPEVLVARDIGSDSWGARSWWIHASYTDCASEGRYNDYQTCSDHSPIFEANNLYDDSSGNVVFPAIFELRIPLESLELSPGARFALAFVATDTSKTWELWPAGATMEAPSTWSQALLEGESSADDHGD